MFKTDKNHEKTPLQIIEEELIRLHDDLRRSSSYATTVYGMIQKIHSHLFELSALHIPSRIKSIEDSIADLYLTDTKGDKK